MVICGKYLSQKQEMGKQKLHEDAKFGANCLLLKKPFKRHHLQTKGIKILKIFTCLAYYRVW